METKWYYTQGDSDRQGPVSEDDLRALVDTGKLNGRDLVWKEGMSDWAAIRDIPGLYTARKPPVTAATVADPAVPSRMAGWMTFVGVLTLIGGILYCLSCVGIVFGIFMIIAGSALLKARTELLNAGIPDERMRPFLGEINKYLAMTGMLYILMLIITVVALLFNLSAVVGAGLTQ